MNYLAHAFLSHPNSQVILGNIMADSVKGRACLGSLLPAVRAGVLQHRAVDKFTDEHPYCLEGRNFLVSIRPLHRAPVFDILMDKLLARSWSRWTREPLDVFAERIRTIVETLQPLHVPRFGNLADRIINDGALVKGTTAAGQRFLLERIGERWGDAGLLLPALNDFARHEDDLVAGFQDFFFEAQASARRYDFSNTLSNT